MTEDKTLEEILETYIEAEPEEVVEAFEQAGDAQETKFAHRYH